MVEKTIITNCIPSCTSYDRELLNELDWFDFQLIQHFYQKDINPIYWLHSVQLSNDLLL